MPHPTSTSIQPHAAVSYCSKRSPFRIGLFSTPDHASCEFGFFRKATLTRQCTRDVDREGVNDFDVVGELGDASLPGRLVSFGLICPVCEWTEDSISVLAPHPTIQFPHLSAICCGSPDQAHLAQLSLMLQPNNGFRSYKERSCAIVPRTRLWRNVP